MSNGRDVLNFKIKQTKDVCKARISSLELRLNKELHKFVLENNTEVSWSSGDKKKYFIVYNNLSDNFVVEVAWKYFIPGVIYFDSRDDAENAISEFDSLLKNIIEMYCLYSKIDSSTCISDVEDILNKVLYDI